MSADELQSLSNAYERAEADFLTTVRIRGDRVTLASAARRTASSAAAFNAEAYRRLHAREDDAWMPLDLLTERTEVLAELWVDISRIRGLTSARPSGSRHVRKTPHADDRTPAR